jgi:hypothetical protein
MTFPLYDYLSPTDSQVFDIHRYYKVDGCSNVVEYQLRWLGHWRFQPDGPIYKQMIVVFVRD